MAGRGRQSTLPAWMTSGNSEHKTLQDTYVPLNTGQFEDASRSSFIKNVDEYRGGADGKGDDRGRDRDRSEKERRSRSRDRSGRRERSRSPGGRDRRRDREKDYKGDRDKKERSASPDGGPVREWRRKSRVSNFDVMPANGIELPGVGSGALSTGAAMSHDQTFGVPKAVGAHNPMIYGSTAQSSAPMMDAAKQQTRHARRLYVGGIPPGTTEDDISGFFTDVIAKAVAPGYVEGMPVLQVYINQDKCFAFVELTSIELTSACLALDGVKYNHRGGQSIIRVRRPNDFKPELMPQHLKPFPPLNLTSLGIVNTTVSDGPGKLFVGGVPYHLTDDQVKELLTAIGPLKSFHLVRDPGSVTSKGYGFCEYFDTPNTESAIIALNGIPLGDKTLTVRLATSQQTSSSGGPMQPPNPFAMQMQMQGASYGGMGGLGTTSIGLGAMGLASGLAGLMPAAPPVSMVQPTRVLKLMNMVTREELYDDREYDDILEDVKSECSQYGRVHSVVIPREKEGFPSASVGLIFVEFADPSMARDAAIALTGRKFAERTVMVDYFDEIKFANRALA